MYIYTFLDRDPMISSRFLVRSLFRASGLANDRDHLAHPGLRKGGGVGSGSVASTASLVSDSALEFLASTVARCTICV